MMFQCFNLREIQREAAFDYKMLKKLWLDAKVAISESVWNQVIL